MNSKHQFKKAPKAIAPFAPKDKGCPSYQAAVDCLKRFSTVNWPVAQNPTLQPVSRDVVRSFLSALAPTQPYEPPVLSEDLEQLNRVVRSITGAVDEQILTAEEADAVINFIASRFAGRRLEEVLAQITMPKTGSWFVVHNHHAWNE